MIKHIAIIASLLLFAIAGLVAILSRSVNAQDDSSDFRILLPDVMDNGKLDAGATAQVYAVLVGPRNTVQVTMTRTDGNLIPYLQLLDSNQELITEEIAANEEVTSITLEFQLSESGWYFIVATSQESVRFAVMEGTYDIRLSGTSYRVFEAIGLTAPPRLPEGQAIVLTGSREFQEIFSQPRFYLAQLPAGGKLNLQIASNTSTVRFLTPNLREIRKTNNNNVDYASDVGEWVVVEISSTSSDPINVTATLTDASGDRITTEPNLVGRLPVVNFENEVSEPGQPTALPTSSATCEVTALDNVARRSGPGLQYPSESVLRYGWTRTVIGQHTDELNWIWWRLEDKSWVREDGVTEGPGCELVPVITLEDPFQPPPGIERCVLTAISNANKRVGPGTDYDSAATLYAQAQELAIGQYKPRGSQYVWWQTDDELWVREDAVTEEGECSKLPVTWP